MNFKKIDLSKYEVLKNDRDGIAAKLPNSNNLYFMYEVSPRVEFDEYPGNPPEDPVIRVMPWGGDGCRIQFRANQVPMRNGYKGKGKAKNFAAIAFLSVRDLEMILNLVKSKR